ncbi:hypothetical protein M9434_001476 [Picochlorum sp. BPE23]|nr:hypothetical protein M9434_001476 [Picochlorum sp. BPE23]
MQREPMEGRHANDASQEHAYTEEETNARVYDGFRPDDKASVVLENVKVFDGDQEVSFQPSCWSRFKVLIWGTAAVLVVAAIIGLSVAMVETNKNTTTNGQSEAEIFPPPGAPPYSPGMEPEESSSGGGVTPEGVPIVVKESSDEDGTLEIMKNPPFNVPNGWTALWWEEFNGNSLDPRWWNYQYGYGEAEGLWAWGNEEEQFYTDSEANVQVSDGTLKITARRQDTVLPDGYVFEYTSGRINTKGKAAFYGGMTTADGTQWNTVRIEASLKAPRPTVGLWAAYWMLPIDMRYGVWASSGEIDIYEMKNQFVKNNMALHYGGPWPKYSERFNAYENRPGGGSFSEDFTVVTMDWSPTEIQMSMDGELAFTLKSQSVDSKNGWYSKSLNGGPNSPFDMPFYIILNLAVGGKYPGDATPDTLTPNTFEIDYIRVFGKN